MIIDANQAGVALASVQTLCQNCCIFVHLMLPVSFGRHNINHVPRSKRPHLEKGNKPHSLSWDLTFTTRNARIKNPHLSYQIVDCYLAQQEDIVYPFLEGQSLLDVVEFMAGDGQMIYGRLTDHKTPRHVP